MTTATTQTGLSRGAGRGGEAAPRPYHWTVDVYHRAWDAGALGHDAQLELVSGRVIERFTEMGPREYRWTADALDRACEMGVFGFEARLELIHGRIIDRMGQSPLHSSLAAYIADCLRAVLTPPFVVRVEAPIRIAFDGEPVPDISVVTGSNLDYLAHHPAPEDVALLVEVSLSSADYDLGEKSLLYSQAGIADYWVVLPEREQIVVHREPTPDGYKEIVRLGNDDTITPLTASEIVLSIRSLLGR